MFVCRSRSSRQDPIRSRQRRDSVSRWQCRHCKRRIGAPRDTCDASGPCRRGCEWRSGPPVPAAQWCRRLAADRRREPSHKSCHDMRPEGRHMVPALGRAGLLSLREPPQPPGRGWASEVSSRSRCRCARSAARGAERDLRDHSTVSRQWFDVELRADGFALRSRAGSGRDSNRRPGDRYGTRIRASSQTQGRHEETVDRGLETVRSAQLCRYPRGFRCSCEVAG